MEFQRKTILSGGCNGSLKSYLISLLEYTATDWRDTNKFYILKEKSLTVILLCTKANSTVWWLAYETVVQWLYYMSPPPPPYIENVWEVCMSVWCCMTRSPVMYEASTPTTISAVLIFPRLMPLMDNDNDNHLFLHLSLSKLLLLFSRATKGIITKGLSSHFICQIVWF